MSLNSECFWDDSELLKQYSGRGFVAGDVVEVLVSGSGCGSSGVWRKARTLEIDDGDNEILVVFDHDSKEQWIPKDSIREFEYRVGDKCIVIESNACVTVKQRLPNGRYEVENDENGSTEIAEKKQLKTNEAAVAAAMSASEAVANQEESLLASQFKDFGIGSSKPFEFYNTIKAPKIRVAHNVKSERKKAASALVSPNETRSNTSATSLAAVTAAVTAAGTMTSSSAIKWENGLPVGEPEVLQMSNKTFSAYLVEDGNMPANWQKHVIRKKKKSQSDTQWKVVISSPDGNWFHNAKELRAFLARYPSLNYNIKDFDFSLHQRKVPAPLGNPATAPEAVAAPADRRKSRAPPKSIVQQLIPGASTPKNTATVTKCPHPNCNKQFRKQNLMQMHVKHYHPELKSYYLSTPNVADLAYARTDAANEFKEDAFTLEMNAALAASSTSVTATGSGVVPPAPFADTAAPERSAAYTASAVSQALVDPSSTFTCPMDPIEKREDVIIVDGQVRKIVQMKPEEIVNCFCSLTEEDGLMIQCELCCCWQHAYCNGFEREDQIPDKYVCSICTDSYRMRESMRYVHDQDWLKDGTVPQFQEKTREPLPDIQPHQELLRKTHDMFGNLEELKEYLYSLNVKVHILRSKNHPKLYLWAKKWKDDLDVKKQEAEDVKSGAESTNGAGTEGLVPAADDDVIDSNVCRVNLIDHIQKGHKRVDRRLLEIEKDVNEIMDEFLKLMELPSSFFNDKANYQVTVEMMTKLNEDFETIRKLSKMLLVENSSSENIAAKV